MAKETGPKVIDLPGIEELFPGGNHYSIDELLDLFIEKNDLPGINSKQQTSLGTSVELEDGSHFIIDSKTERLYPHQFPGMELEPGFGGPETNVTKVYCLEGKIGGMGTVKLEARVSTTTHYRMEKSGPPLFTEYAVKEGEPMTYIFRNDDYDLWFLEEAHGRPKETGPEADSEQISAHI
jgi:hypothetical protein